MSAIISTELVPFGQVGDNKTNIVMMAVEVFYALYLLPRP